ncbi:hypothetical protein CFC21_091984, partial [Triticum aestivum]
HFKGGECSCKDYW